MNPCDRTEHWLDDLDDTKPFAPPWTLIVVEADPLAELAIVEEDEECEAGC